MADIAVHDVANPSLDLGGDNVGGVLRAHGDVDILATVVDGRDGADKVLGGNALALCPLHQHQQTKSTYSSSSGKRLNQSSLGIGLNDLVNGVLALGNLQLIAQTRASHLQDASAGNAVQDQLVVQRSGDELLLAVLARPDNEEVAGTGLSALAILAIQPQDLVVAAATGI